MSNGCICCTLRDDLLAEVSRLAQEGRFDYLLIESTGNETPSGSIFGLAVSQGEKRTC